MIILKFLLSAFILWVGSVLSPETIIFTDAKALIVTTVILYVVELLISLIYTGVLTLVALTRDFIGSKSIPLMYVVDVLIVILTIAVALTIKIISLYIVSKYYPGFEITDKYHMIFLTIALSATTGIGNKINKEDKNGTRQNNDRQ